MPRLPPLRTEQYFEQWNELLIEALGLRGYGGEVLLHGSAMQSVDRVYILDIMMTSLGGAYRDKLREIGFDASNAHEHPKSLFDIVKRFIVDDLIKEITDMRPGRYVSWGRYLRRIAYIKQRLGELGSPINDETAVTHILAGLKNEHIDLYGQVARMCGFSWTKLMTELARIGPQHGPGPQAMHREASPMPSILPSIGKDRTQPWSFRSACD